MTEKFGSTCPKNETNYNIISICRSIYDCKLELQIRLHCYGLLPDEQTLMVQAALVATSFQSVFNNAMVCRKVKCRIRSHLLNVTSSQPLLKVDLDRNGVPTGVSVTGRNSDSNTTVFVLEHCRRQGGGLKTRISWERNKTYTLAAKSNQVTLEVFKAGTAPTADRFYFSVVSNRRRCINRGTSSLHACVAFKTLLPIGSYIRADKQGHVTLRYQSPMYRSTWFWLESCSRIS